MPEESSFYGWLTKSQNWGGPCQVAQRAGMAEWGPLPPDLENSAARLLLEV